MRYVSLAEIQIKFLRKFAKGSMIAFTWDITRFYDGSKCVGDKPSVIQNVW